MTKDFTNHPFEVRVREMVAQAERNRAERGPDVKRPARIADHIHPRFDDEVNKWGMFNTRLQEWCGRDEKFNRFRTEEAAIAWYREILE